MRGSGNMHTGVRTQFKGFLDREGRRFPYAGDLDKLLAAHRAGTAGVPFPEYLVDVGAMAPDVLQEALAAFRKRGGRGGGPAQDRWRLVVVTLDQAASRAHPDFELAVGQRVLVGGKRSKPLPDVDWALPDPHASRRHCWLHGMEHGVEVIPHPDARNPTRINGHAIAQDTARAFEGDLLRLGRTVLQVRSTSWDKEEVRLDFRPCPYCGFRISLSDVVEGDALSRRGTYYHANCYRAASDIGNVRVPEHEIREWIGGGGMGNVFLAWHPATHTERAVKVIRPEVLASQPELALRFSQEARCWGRVGSHPGIVRLLEARTPEVGDSPYYLVMEYVDGVPLSVALRHKGRFRVGEAVGLTLHLAQALEHAFALDVIHRDVKPDNVLLDRAGRPHLTDWGLGRIARETIFHVTRSRTGMGTPGYAPPEQWEDMQNCDQTADIYGLGATLYQLLSGRVPFEGASLGDVIQLQEAGPPEPLDQGFKDVPRELAMVVNHCLEPDRRKRFRTPGELARALTAVPTSSASG